jgi:putative membrane protein
MTERTHAAHWIIGALALALTQCAGDQQSAPADSPLPPPAEPPAELTSAQPAADTAAQSAEERAADDKTPKSDAANAASPAESPKKATLTDPQIAAITDLANTAEIEQAKLARTKSKNAEVQKFAAMMIAHHGEAKQKQTKLKLATADSPLSTQLLEDGNKTLAALKEAKGADFDRRYFETQVEGHQKVLDAINNDLLPSVKSPELKAYLEEIKPTVEQHLQAARDAQQAIASSSGARGTSSATSTK